VCGFAGEAPVESIARADGLHATIMFRSSQISCLTAADLR
jgi:hypothetical protein